MIISPRFRQIICFLVILSFLVNTRFITSEENSNPVEKFLGYWVNEDPNTGGITHIKIRKAGNSIFVHVWGRCHPMDCDWGEESTSISDAQDGEISLTWHFSFAVKKQKIRLLPKDRLQVHTYTHFIDNSGRKDYSMYEYFRKVSSAPVATLKAFPTSVYVGDDVTFDASLSHADGQIVGYLFDFGDGTPSFWTIKSTISHSYTEPGIYLARVKVRDGQGVESDWSSPVRIEVKGEPEPILLDVGISEIDATIPVYKSSFKWKEPLLVWFKILNPSNRAMMILLQCQLRDPVTEAISVSHKIVNVHPGTDWYNLSAYAPSHAGRLDIVWEIYALNWEKKYDEIRKEDYIIVEEGELPKEPQTKKFTTLRVIPSNITIKLGESISLIAFLTADDVGELEYKTINWRVEKGALSSTSSLSGESVIYNAPNYETGDRVIASFLGSEGYQQSNHTVYINVKTDIRTITVETEWWEVIRPEEPQFIITVFNKGNYEFNITKVVLSGIEVWKGQFSVSPHSKGELKIFNIEKVFERHLLNNLNEVYIQNAVKQPAFYHNIVIFNRTTAWYSEGHTQVYASIDLIETLQSKSLSSPTLPPSHTSVSEHSSQEKDLFELVFSKPSFTIFGIICTTAIAVYLVRVRKKLEKDLEEKILRELLKS